MPTLNLPKDTRWGDLGAGLGGLVSAAATAYVDKAIGQDVATIQADNEQFPTQDAKLRAIAQKYGNKGIQSLVDQLKVNAATAQIGLDTAQTAGVKARTEGTQLDTAIKGQRAPAELAKIKAETAADEARTGLTRAETDFTAGPKTALTAAQTTHTGEESAKTDVETRILRDQQNMIARLGQAGNIEADLKAQGIEDPRDIAAAKTELAAGGLKAYNTFVQAKLRNREQVEKPQMLPTDIRKAVTTAEGQVPNLQPFLEPPSPGVPSGFGAGIAAWLNKVGLGNDPELMQRYTHSELSMARFAEGGTGLSGGWRVGLGKQITPQVEHTPVYNVLQVGAIVKGEIAQMQSQLEQAKAVKGMDTKPIEHAIEKYQDMLDTSNSLWWTKPPPNGELPKFYYKGNEVDYKTLQVIRPNAEMPAAQVYRDKAGGTFTGEKVNKLSRKAGVDPQQALQMMQEGQ